MKKLLTIMASMFLVACGSNSDGDSLDLTSRFNGTWNIHEKFEKGDNGEIIYHAIPWGGLVGSMRERNLPVDWTPYESVSVEFAEPTKVGTQLMIKDRLRVFGKPGITKMTCYFDGQDVTQIDEVAIQSSDSSILKVKRVYLTPGSSVWDSTPIWEGHCVFGDWEEGFIIPGDKFWMLWQVINWSSFMKLTGVTRRWSIGSSRPSIMARIVHWKGMLTS